MCNKIYDYFVIGMRRTAVSLNHLVNETRGSTKCLRFPLGIAVAARRSFASSNVNSSSGFTRKVPFAVAIHHVRNYAQNVRMASACWNCNELSKNRLICSACGYLQDVDTDIDYFDLLDIPKSFRLEQLELTKRFRKLQTLVHPDKYSNKTSREQTNSTDWSSLINKAYKTLSVPIERGQYILKLHGQQLPQDNSALDKEFLLDMMHRNEVVEDANDTMSLQQLDEEILDELNEKTVQLNALFENNNLDKAKLTLVQMKYLLSIQNSIKNKLQKLSGS